MSLGDHSFWQRGTEVLLTTALEPYSKFITQGEMLFTYLYSQIFCLWVFRCWSRMNSKPLSNIILWFSWMYCYTVNWTLGCLSWAHGTSSRWGRVTNTSWHGPNSGLKVSTDKMRWWFLLLMTLKTDWVTTQKMLQYPEQKTPSKWLWNLLDSEKAGLSMPKHEGTSKRLR